MYITIFSTLTRGERAYPGFSAYRLKINFSDKIKQKIRKKSRIIEEENFTYFAEKLIITT